MGVQFLRQCDGNPAILGFPADYPIGFPFDGRTNETADDRAVIDNQNLAHRTPGASNLGRQASAKRLSLFVPIPDIIEAMKSRLTVQPPIRDSLRVAVCVPTEQEVA
jgi:hypothetical protein